VLGKTWIDIHGRPHALIAHDTLRSQTKAIYAALGMLDDELRNADFVPDTRYVSHNGSKDLKEHLLDHHSEKLAIALGLISTPPGTPILMRNNIRVCPNCHAAIAMIAKLRRREITLHDANGFHHFRKDGTFL